MAYVRIYYSRSFIDANENYITGGGSVRGSNFYKELTCAVNRFTHIVTVPQFTIPATTNASDTRVRATFMLFDVSRAFVKYLGAGWVVPETAINWNDLVEAND